MLSSVIAVTPVSENTPPILIVSLFPDDDPHPASDVMHNAALAAAAMNLVDFFIIFLLFYLLLKCHFSGRWDLV
jgi:hypothetical protein